MNDCFGSYLSKAKHSILLSSSLMCDYLHGLYLFSINSLKDLIVSADLAKIVVQICFVANN